ncbi:hypothetical protein [Bradyrhizobium jicamae]|uniref:hypothetical protein n=1 Tax=Bradyrhizobium jicamae TaxID=280332 RepID=UPI001BACEB6C|nr:hypothetical protein [Bradyrhizobium jicamae]MBR0933084.1 hypothetical protein [Bradyrhizobium jicamae]
MRLRLRNNNLAATTRWGAIKVGLYCAVELKDAVAPVGANAKPEVSEPLTRP